MKIIELSAQYRAGGEACYSRVAELKAHLSNDCVDETEKLLLRRRITLLTAMARETIETAKYLAAYYAHLHKEL